MAEISDAQPAVQFTTTGSGDVAPIGANAGDLRADPFAVGAVAALAQDVEDLGALMHLGAHVVGGPGVAPHHRVVAHDAAGRVVQGAQDRVAGMVGSVEAGGDLLDVVGADDAGVDALQLVDLGSPVHGAQGAVGVGQGQVAPLAEHHIDVQIGRHRVVKLQRPVIEGHTGGGEVVGPHDRGVAARSAAAQIGLVEHGHVGDAVVAGQVVSRGQAVNAPADHDGVIGALELGVTPYPGPSPAP